MPTRSWTGNNIWFLRLSPFLSRMDMKQFWFWVCLIFPWCQSGPLLMSRDHTLDSHAQDIVCRDHTCNMKWCTSKIDTFWNTWIHLTKMQKHNQTCKVSRRSPVFQEFRARTAAARWSFPRPIHCDYWTYSSLLLAISWILFAWKHQQIKLLYMYKYLFTMRCFCRQSTHLSVHTCARALTNSFFLLEIQRHLGEARCCFVHAGEPSSVL